ncbi:MAG TPA: penicillin-binding protein [Candidatus Uhrbacteria bacterium]|nr:penicillin-binding protein [Candidatus Uhrbacteria bacterium]
MPISQLTKSPKNWRKYSKQGKKNKIKKIRSVKKKNTTKIFISWLVALFIAGTLLSGIVFIGALAWYSKDLPDPNKVIDRVMAESTKIYDRTGENLLWEIHGDEKRTIIELDQISDHIIKATIAAEDKHFYEHKGINIFSIVQGVILDPLRGRGTRGGSTLTQQLIKNAILTSERKISRKFKEWILAYQMEKKFTKDQILKMYFNEIPYGSVNYGVESASNYFFGKSAKDVTLAEAAILAALPQAPTRLSPYGSNIDKLINRQHWVLNEMVKVGFITKEKAEEAKQQPLEFKKEKIANITAPHFVFYVRELLAEKLGEKSIEQGGLKVITTLDLEKQKIAEEAVKNANERNIGYNATNASLVSIDAKTGEILAMVGSQNFQDETISGQVNVAIRPRQPGSSIKPIVYAAAFEKGFTSKTVIYDVFTSFPSSPKPYEPRNYDKKERGPVTIKQALAGSLNIPAVKTLYLAGYEYVINLMQKLGYSTITPESQCGLSLVLGGCEVKLLDHVGAFSAFARDGERAETFAILKIENKAGKHLLEEFKPKKHKVYGENSVRQINNILTDAQARSFIFGDNPNLSLTDRPVAVKTGTTNDNKDAWTVGYTPSFVTGVWVGNSDGTNMSSSADGSNVAAPIWNEYMRKTLAGTPVETFKEPAEINPDLHPVLRGEITGKIEVEIDKASGKLATPLTPASFIEKRTYRQDHCILHYIDKNNPAGPAPENPENDPMYRIWEEAVQAWVKKQAEEKGETYDYDLPPEEYDDLHIPGNIPTLTLISPQNNQMIENYPLNFEVKTSATRGISRVQYEINGQVIGVARNYPFSLQVNSLDIDNGYHKLKVTAFDDIDNSNSVQIELNLKLPTLPPQIDWLNPRQNASFYSSNFPLNIDFTLSKITDLQKAIFYYNGNKISELFEFPQEHLSIVWQNTPGPGQYEIYAQLEEKDGSQTQTEKLLINILD